MRKIITALIFVLSGSLAMAQNYSDMTPEERASFGDAVREYLLENPEVIMEAVAILQNRERAAAVGADRELAERYAEQLGNDGYSYVGGNPDGAITMVEFLDYRCGYCRRAHDEIAALVAANSDVRFVVKELPVLGDESVLASRAALAVLVNDGPDVYHRMNDLLMRFDGPFNDATLFDIATEAGADAPRMSELMGQPLITEMISNNRTLAATLQVTGTPTFVIGTEMVRGYVAPEIMNSILEEVRQAVN